MNQFGTNLERHRADAAAGFYQPGTILVLDIFGRVVRTVNRLTSWAAPAYRVEHDGTLARVA